jgi:hypothetical protein
MLLAIALLSAVTVLLMRVLLRRYFLHSPETLDYDMRRDVWHGDGRPPRVRSSKGGWTKLGTRYRD